ncbi:MAG: M13 family metallopeptidase [Rikenellaceae bacterium]
MKKFMIGVTSVMLASCGGASVQETAKVPAINPANFDTTTCICQDFYQHFNGGWKKNNPLKDEFARYGSFDVLRENNEIRINELFTEISKQTNEPGSVGQKIADLYTMGLDSTTLNSQGVAPVKADLQAINAINNSDATTTMLATMHRESGSPFFRNWVSTDDKNSSINIMYISQGGLGMGTKDYYTEEKNSDMREQYKSYISKLFTLAGYSTSDVERVVKSVMDIEMKIAEASKSNVELRDPYANYNMLDIADFKKEFSSINWDLYAEIVGFTLPSQINVGQPAQLACVNSILKTTPIQNIKDYLSFNLLDRAAPYLSDSFSDASFDFYGKAMSGKQAQLARWKRALAVPNGSLGEAVGEMYVAKYFPAEYKAKMVALVDNLQKSLSKHIDNLAWMSDVTKEKAQEKLSTFYVKIGYPDKWKDYSTLNIDASLSYWDNIKAISKWRKADNLAKLGQPVDKDEWHMSPQTVNAYYNPTSNEICFPAAILQPPFFNPDADDAVNYGAIGVVIGHEMTHGFDDQGRQYDKEGNLKDWWTAEDAEAFDVKAQMIVEQFNKIEVLPGIFANGAFTLGENIADQGGLRVAYTAMKDAQNGVEPEPIDGFTADQRFYIGYAAIWAQNVRDQEIERLTNTDPHSLGINRVNASLKNIDTFYNAFNITSGDMYVAPEDRVIIW